MAADLRFPSKVLIAGEFTVIWGGDALAIPLDKFAGSWARLSQPDPQLYDLGEYLKTLDFINSKQFIQDIHDGWQFISNIPPGYGLGSSGALSASIYDHYKDVKDDDLKTIQFHLAAIEHFYHGKSSGFDPLISYKNQGFAIVNKEVTVLPDVNPSLIENKLYLLDSGTPRGQINSISWFYEQLKDSSFEIKVKELSNLNQQFIRAWLRSEFQIIPGLFRLISELEFEIFQPLISDSLHAAWSHGLSSDQYVIKLCGKGGGGYYLLWLNEPNPDPIELTMVPVF